MKILVLLLLVLSLVACNPFRLCRDQALIDARTWECKGYQTRIAAYAVGGDGVIAAFPFSLIYVAEYGFAAHVQAQIWDEGRWKWLNGGLSDESTYSRQMILPDGKGGLADYWYFSPQEWRDFEAKQGRWMPEKKVCK